MFVRAHGQAFVDAVVAFCASSELLSVGAPEQQRQASQLASQARRRSAAVAGAACSQAAACLSEPKVRQRGAGGRAVRACELCAVAVLLSGFQACPGSLAVES